MDSVTAWLLQRVQRGLGFQHNNSLVAYEPAVDFEDASGLAWTLTDDPTNLRMKVTPSLGALSATSLAVTGGIAGAGLYGSSFPVSPANGQIFTFIGTSGTVMPFIYDGTLGHWYSPVFSYPVIGYVGGGGSPINQTDVTTATILPASSPLLFTKDLLTSAGCTIYSKIQAVVSGNGSKAAYIGIGFDYASNGGGLTGAGNYTGTEVNSTGTMVFLDGTWTTTLFGSCDTAMPYVYGYRTSGGSGTTVSYYAATIHIQYVR